MRKKESLVNSLRQGTGQAEARVIALRQMVLEKKRLMQDASLSDKLSLDGKELASVEAQVVPS